MRGIFARVRDTPAPIPDLKPMQIAKLQRSSPRNFTKCKFPDGDHGHGLYVLLVSAIRSAANGGSEVEERINSYITACVGPLNLKERWQLTAFGKSSGGHDLAKRNHIGGICEARVGAGLDLQPSNSRSLAEQ